MYDIFIMVDGSVADNVDFAKVKEFLTNFIIHSNISPSGSRVGMLQFSLPNLASLEMRFGSSQERSEILETINYMDYMEGAGRHTGQALQAVDSWVGISSLFWCCSILTM